MKASSRHILGWCVMEGGKGTDIWFLERKKYHIRPIHSTEHKNERKKIESKLFHIF